jgi:hypothetical protein
MAFYRGPHNDETGEGPPAGYSQTMIALDSAGRKNASAGAGSQWQQVKHGYTILHLRLAEMKRRGAAFYV